MQLHTRQYKVKMFATHKRPKTVAKGYYYAIFSKLKLSVIAYWWCQCDVDRWCWHLGELVRTSNVQRARSERQAPAPSSTTRSQCAYYRVQTPGYVPKKPGGAFGYTHRKKPTLLLYLILVYTLYATNNAIFYCFKAFKALSYWVF